MTQTRLIPAHRLLSLTAPALLALSLAGCARLGLEIGGGDPMPVAGLKQFDGSYRSRAVVIAGENCPVPAEGMLLVGDRRFVLPYAPGTVLAATIADDGAVQARANGASMAGRIDGRILDVTVTGGDCQTRYSGRATLNRS